jgi:N-acetyl-anhydromuramyl-L-alanine amidase AmpD
MTVVERLTTSNCWPGRAGRAVEGVVLHVTDGDTAAGALSWFANPDSKVSAHYVVDRDGTVYRAVREADTAWANGVVRRPNLTNPLIAGWARSGLNPNLVTVSVEAVGRPGAPWPAAQRAAVAGLIADLCRRHRLPLDRTHVIGHAELDSVSRAHCPGLAPEQWAALLAEATTPAASAPDPTNGHAVGAGIRAALAAANDTALGPERYFRAQDGAELSVCPGRHALYLWSADGGHVYRIPRL